MTRLTDVDSSNLNAAFLTWENLNNQFTYSLTLSAAYSPTDWWSSFTNVTAYHLENKADGDADIRSINIAVNAANIFSQHIFSLPKNIKLEISGWYGTPSIWGGTFYTDGMWSLDAGVQIGFLKERATFKVAVSDIFETSNWSGYSNYGPLLTEGTGGHDTRRLKLNFSYLFGNQKVKKRERESAIEDESKRVGSGGN
jgi:hypothetical protein